jgi:beta-glucosidase
VIVVLSNGAPVEMPWIERVDGLLECYLGGQALGGAVADLLFGEVNPSGKLAETFPKQLSHNPSYLNFPGDGDEVHYAEGIFVGYRYYEKKGIAPLFPFGFGLSYTSFAYQTMVCNLKDMRDDETVSVVVAVKNTGSRAGKEIVQLYVHADTPRVMRPEKELKGFDKIFLEAGQQASVTFLLGRRAFAHYDPALGGWRVESGDYTLMVGSSSADIALTQKFHVDSSLLPIPNYTRNSTIGYLLADDRDAARAVMAELQEQFGWGRQSEEDRSIDVVQFFPLRALISFSQGKFSEANLAEWLRTLNQLNADDKTKSEPV